MQSTTLTSRLVMTTLLLDTTSVAAIRAGILEWDHSFPFDRIPAAQALFTQSTLITRGRVVGELKG